MAWYKIKDKKLKDCLDKALGAAKDAFEKAQKDKNYRKSATHYLDNLDPIFNKHCK